MAIDHQKSARRLSLALCAAALLLALPAVAQDYTGRLSVHWSPTHHSAIHAEMFANEVNERAEGRLEIEFFPSGQLLGIREQLGAVTSGAVELGGIVSIPPINKNYNVTAYPGLFDSYEQQRAFFSSPKRDARSGTT